MVIKGQLPRGKRVTFSCLDRFSGYGARNGGGGSADCLPRGAGGIGGMVDAGFGDVRAYTRAAAMLSA